MKTLFNAVRCLECGHEMAADLFTARCSACGSVWLQACYDCDALPEDWPALLAQRPATMWRYRELLPFPDAVQPVTMDEGWTPLLHAQRLEQELGHSGLWIKDERRHPTGSFKDRQASFTVSALKARGVKELVLASTGNAAAAYAAYCARAGIKLWVFLTSSVPAEKMRELALYGAEVIKITGTYDQAKKIAADFAARHGITYDKGAKGITGKESMKTIALEITEQMGWRAPDWYVQAVSGGIGPLGVLKGFQDLYTAGLIDRVPKMAVVQVEGCAPMVRSWEQDLAEAEPVYQPDTLITILGTGKPGLTYKILKQASDRYGGAMVAVSDGEAFRAMRRVARTEGFSMEPAASVAFAGCEKLLARGYIQPGEQVIVNCSGHTFSAEKHALEDRYTLSLEVETTSVDAKPSTASVPSFSQEGLAAALEQLDEQITTIVVIDDNPRDSRLICRLLQSLKNYRVFEAHNGPDGLDLVRQRQPELVMLDLNLPNMDGFAVLQALKADERTREIPVVIVSAKSPTADEWENLHRYTESIWQKGNFSARELLYHVAEILGDKVEKPAQANSKPQQAPAAVTTEPPAVEQFGQERWPCILVIDDRAVDARLMRRLFESRHRFKVMEAHSGAEALEAIEQAPPDLIILDLVLPDINGEQLLEMLRANEATRETPVLIVSAKDLEPAMRAKLAAQADSIWIKGMLDRSSLLAHVETILSE